MSRTGRRRRMAVTTLVVCTAASTLAGCGPSTTMDPGTASSATPVPGTAPQLGGATVGGLALSDITLLRSGSSLSLAGRITNAGPADALTSVSSQVTAVLTLTPPLAVASGSTVDLSAPQSTGRTITLTENARLEPGGTVDLTLHFQRAGDVQVFAGFTDV